MGIVKEPIYQQLNQALAELIRSGEFKTGAKFLTERQISERFGVSRATANKALASLVSEGLVTFRKGVGTYVQLRPLDYNLRALVSFTDEAIAAGMRPETRVLSYETMTAAEAPEDIAGFLRAGPEEQLLYLERLRLADEMPVILERRHIVSSFCPGLTAADAAGSIYDLFSHRYGLPVEGADQSVQAVNIHGADARILKVRHDAAGFLVTSVGRLSEGRPLWFERTLYRGDAYEFHNRLGGIQSPGVSPGRFLYHT
jgi:DNA-binding GntR family transcriptional regulator